MAPNVPVTPELVRSAFALLAMRAELDAARTELPCLTRPGDEPSADTQRQQQALVEHMLNEVAGARYTLAQCLVEAMRSTKHTGSWLYSFMVDELAGQWVLIYEDGGQRCVYTSAETWAEILATDTRLIPRERRIRPATDDHWLTLEAVLPQLLGHETTRDIQARGEATLAAINAQ